MHKAVENNMKKHTTKTISIWNLKTEIITEEFPSNITIKKEQSENNSHKRTDDQLFYEEDDMSYVISYMIHDITDQQTIHICGKLGIDTLQHLGELEQEDIMEIIPNKRWVRSVDNMRKYFLNTGCFN